MPILISNVEMTDLANKLAKMRFNRAKGYIRHLDKNVRLDKFRVSVGPEWHTRFALPDKGLWITLIETHETRGTPDTRGYIRMRFKFVEARVEPMPEYVATDKQLGTI